MTGWGLRQAAIYWSGSECRWSGRWREFVGYHALQLGLPELDALQANRMPHRWVAATLEAIAHDPSVGARRERIAVVTDPSALPFAEHSLDLVVLPHSLELSQDPHATLREVERVLVPEGRVVICCFNPTSLWGLHRLRARVTRRMGFGELFLPEAGEFIGHRRLRDWLRLLSFEVESARFGCYRPAVRSDRMLARFSWMDHAGARWWPAFGAVYFLVAVKRVRGMRLLGAAWKKAPQLANAPVSIANKSHKTGATAGNSLESH